MIAIDNFQTPFRRDRNENGGGILVYISQQLSGASKKELEDPELELMWVEIQFFTHRPLLLGCCYRPPNSTAAFFSKLEQVLEKVAKKDILLVGDFNAKHKDWFIGDNTNCNGQTLKDLMDRFDMTQLCSEATHLDNNGEPSSLLDLAFTNVPHHWFLNPLAHLIIYQFSLKHQSHINLLNPLRTVSKSWMYSQKDHVKMMNSFLFDEWSHVFQPEDDINEILDSMEATIFSRSWIFHSLCFTDKSGQAKATVMVQQTNRSINPDKKIDYLIVLGPLVCQITGKNTKRRETRLQIISEWRMIKKLFSNCKHFG